MKKIVLFIFALICIFCLVACSGSGDAGKVPDEVPGEENPGEKPDKAEETATTAVTVYIDGVKEQTVYTDAAHGYRITPPEKPEDVTTNPNSEKYFYGWFVDSNFQTPLLDSTKFTKGGAIYGKWITVYSNSFVYTVNYGKATITGFLENAPTVLVIPAYINSFPVERIGVDAFKNATTIRTVILCNGIEEVGGFAGCNSIEKIEIPKSVTRIGASAFARCGFINFDIPAQITSIGASAFASCTRLRSVNIPGSVKTIGSAAFANCDNLLQITLPNGVTNIAEHTFEGCTNLTSITIGNGVTSIGSEAFSGCTNLTSITIPSGVTNIGERAFSGCSCLTNIAIPYSVTRIGQGAFAGCNSLTKMSVPFVGENKDGSGCRYFGHVFSTSSSGTGNYANEIPTSLKTIIVTGGVYIGEGAFKGCTGLTSIIIPDSVTKIGKGAFAGCNALTTMSIPFVGENKNGSGCQYFGHIFSTSSSGTGNYANVIPTSLKTIIVTGGVCIGESAFENCTGLTSISILSSVTSIGKRAFYNCAGLTGSITIPNSVTSIGEYVFYNCRGLTGISIPYRVRSIGERAFEECTGLTSISIPSSVTSIGKRAFYNCRGLTGISIPNGVTSIGEYVFYNCRGLTGISIPNGVTSIGDYAFYGCTSLTSITIPSSVKSIGYCAFEGCTGLTSITIPNSVTSIGGEAFKGCTKLVYTTYDNAKYLGNAQNPYLVLVKVSDTSITSCTIHSNTRFIYDSAFRSCSSLTNITIPSSVTSIGNYAFYGCTDPTSITIPNSVTSIGDYAFYGWESWQTIYIEKRTDITNWNIRWAYSCRAEIVWET